MRKSNIFSNALNVAVLYVALGWLFTGNGSTLHLVHHLIFGGPIGFLAGLVIVSSVVGVNWLLRRQIEKAYGTEKVSAKPENLQKPRIPWFTAVSWGALGLAFLLSIFLRGPVYLGAEPSIPTNTPASPSLESNIAKQLVDLPNWKEFSNVRFRLWYPEIWEINGQDERRIHLKYYDSQTDRFASLYLELTDLGAALTTDTMLRMASGNAQYRDALVQRAFANEDGRVRSPGVTVEEMTYVAIPALGTIPVVGQSGVEYIAKAQENSNAPVYSYFTLYVPSIACGQKFTCAMEYAQFEGEYSRADALELLTKIASRLQVRDSLINIEPWE